MPIVSLAVLASDKYCRAYAVLWQAPSMD